MIFYFSGTGNSLWVAKELKKAFNEPLYSIGESIKAGQEQILYSLQPEEKLFFVFPVHSWGPAALVRTFIERLELQGYTDQRVYSVCTCGDECGYTKERMRDWLALKAIRQTECYSLQMPNNYVLLPGFDVDPKEVEQQKLDTAPERLHAIIQAIQNDQKEVLYCEGTMPFLKSRLVYPLFVRYAIKKNSFYATDACISCGICAALCPTGTITQAKGELPQWEKDTCVQCLACLHRCPQRAIEYGKISQKKGRYHHPLNR